MSVVRESLPEYIVPKYRQSRATCTAEQTAWKAARPHPTAPAEPLGVISHDNLVVADHCHLIRLQRVAHRHLRKSPSP